MKRLVLTLLVFISALPITYAQDTKTSRIASHVQSLNELTERRRTSKFFTNEQTIQHGLPIGFVNTGFGNLTFVQRDLVATTRLPVIFARVYNSSLADSGDFGQGWQLSLAETITPAQDGSLRYVDESASPTQIVPTKPGYAVAQGEVSDISSIDVLSNQSLQINYHSGWQKHFGLLGERYQLVSILDAYGNRIELNYNKLHKVSKIAGQNGRFVDISRDKHGRIIGVTDDNHRQVTYQYDKQGRLASVNDLGQNRWWYSYDGKGLLKKVTDPEGHVAASFRYGADNKTTKANIRGIEHRYHYQGNSTTVTDQHGNTTVLVQNENGITTQVTNSEGTISTVDLNDNYRITKLGYDGLLNAHFSYDQNGRVSQLKRRAPDGQFELLHYRYDAKGRLTGITNGETLISQSEFTPLGQPLLLTSDGTQRSYTYDKNGNVLSQTEGDIHRTFGYNNSGLLTSMTENGAKATFEYDPTGKLTKITFPNGNSHQYQYNDRGLRTQTSRSDGSAVYYTYDKAGSLTELRKTTVTGDSQQSDIMLDDNLTKQFVVGGQQALDISYSNTGNPTTIVYEGKTINYQYDALNRLVSINEGQGEPISYQYKNGEDDIRIQLDARSANVTTAANKASRSLAGLNALYTRSKGAAWRHVSWNDALGRLQLVNAEGYIAPDAVFKSAAQRRRLYNAIATDTKNQRSFDKPSSSVFVPIEYSAVNCEPQYCGMDAVILNGPGEVTVNQMADFSAQALLFELRDCEPSYSFYVDGSYAHTNSSGNFSVGFNSAGSHSVDVSAVCAYCPWVGVLYAAASVNSVLPQCHLAKTGLTVPDAIFVRQPAVFTATIEEACTNGTLTYQWFLNDSPISWAEQQTYTHSFNLAGDYIIKVQIGCSCTEEPVEIKRLITVFDKCDSEHVDREAKLTLSNLSQQAFEYGRTFICVNFPGSPHVETAHPVESFDDDQPHKDPCKVSIWTHDPDTVGLAHTHPYFNNTDEFNMYDGCQGDKEPKNDEFLINFNAGGRTFSEKDQNNHPASGKDNYLGLPLRDAVKVMRKGKTTVETLP